MSNVVTHQRLLQPAETSEGYLAGTIADLVLSDGELVRATWCGKIDTDGRPFWAWWDVHGRMHGSMDALAWRLIKRGNDDPSTSIPWIHPDPTRIPPEPVETMAA